MLSPDFEWPWIRTGSLVLWPRGPHGVTQAGQGLGELPEPWKSSLSEVWQDKEKLTN